MDREDIIRMARGQGLPETETEGVFIVNTDDLGRMLAAEREAVIAIVNDNSDSDGLCCTDDLLAAIRARGDI